MENIYVVKRNGSVVPFDESKIFNAIYKAMKNGSGIIRKKIATKISEEIREYIDSDRSLSIVICEADKKIVTIESIENLVYNLLNENKQFETAKAYEGYRAVQEFKRKNNTVDESILSLIGNKNEEVSMENSNKNATLISTQRDLIAGEVSKDIARRKLLPAHIVQAHDDGVIHIHDTDYFAQPMTNCCLINLEDMFLKGTVINEKLVETPKSFLTACTITTQIIAQVSSSQYGGQSITIAHIAPFLRVTYDKAYYNAYTKFQQRGIELNLVEEWSVEEAEQTMMKELKAGIQTIRYQLNTLNSVNG